jgi:hypothetical protein
VTNNEYAEKYMITSVRGRVYNRTMLRAYVSAAFIFGVDKAAALALLDNDAFMSPKYGQVPSAIVRDIARKTGGVSL